MGVQAQQGAHATRSSCSTLCSSSACIRATCLPRVACTGIQAMGRQGRLRHVCPLGNYTDVADEGSDMLFSVCYDIYRSAQTIYNEKTRSWEPLLYALVTDMIFTDANTDVTVVTVSEMINRMGTQRAWVESNGGGSQFGKLLSRRVKAQVSQFHQSANKESRIVTNAGYRHVHRHAFGVGELLEGAYRHITEFLRNFSANRHDDMADGLTGV